MTTHTLEIYELWNDIKGYEGEYQVSNLGRVRSLDRVTKHSLNNFRKIKGKILKAQTNNQRDGYIEISLHKNGREKRFKVHRLVAESFIDNPLNLPQVNHIDGDKANNSVSNLEWITDIDNKNHAWLNGLYTSEHRKRKIECIETGYIYDSIVSATEQIPCDRRSMFRHLKGERKTIKGLTYRYVKEYREGINE